jgi:putative transposase
MNQLYRTLGVSKQAFHQRMNRYLESQDEREQLLTIIHQVRREHPEMGAREMYFLLSPHSMGRDKFEQFCFENGLRVPRKPSFVRTTNSLGVTRFPNLLVDFKLVAPNQVWASDITYYRIDDEFYYLTFIIDLYTRVIVGYSVSRTLLTEHTTLPALKTALRNRKISAGLILHSDGGGQYYCKLFLEITRSYLIRNSMGKTAYENPNAERINGTIKNSYIRHYNPKDYADLIRQTARAVKNYNIRPHSSLKRVSPFELNNNMLQMLKCGQAA